MFCIASRLTTTEKDIPTAYPDITQTVQRQPRSPKPDNHTSHSRQEPYNVIMSERITVQVPDFHIVNQSTQTITAQHTHTARLLHNHIPILGICVNLV